MKRKKNMPAEGAYITVISQGAKLVGELTVDAKLHIDGVFEGSIVSSSEVSIGASGFVKGNLTAQRILVSGFAQGDIDCECLEVVGSGKVFGDVTCVDLVIEPGGRFVGTSHIKDAADVPALADRRQPAAEIAAPAPATPEASDGPGQTGKPEETDKTKAARAQEPSAPPAAKPQVEPAVAAPANPSSWASADKPVAAVADDASYDGSSFRQDQGRLHHR